MHIILSPHYDDAVLSLGNFINKLCLENQKVLIVNIFTQCPSNIKSLSKIAEKYIKEDTGNQRVNVYDAIKLSEIRESEDLSALNILGIDSLDLLQNDAIYRGTPFYYTTENSLFGDINKNEISLHLKILKLLEENQLLDYNFLYYSPLGIGNHIDHNITSKVGKELLINGYCCNFYEEFPYYLKSNLNYLNKRLSFINPEKKFIFTPYIQKGESEKKHTAIMSYKTQLTWLRKEVRISEINNKNFEKIWMKKIGGKQIG